MKFLHLDWQELNELMEFGFKATEGVGHGIESCASSPSTSKRPLEMSWLVPMVSAETSWLVGSSTKGLL